MSEISQGGGGGGGSGSVATDTIWDTKGDIAAATASDTATKLAAGANDTLLMAASGQATGLKWGDASTVRTALDVPTNAAAVLDTLVDAKGDILTASANDTPARLAVGTNDYGLVADSTQSTGLNWKAVAGAELGYAEITAEVDSTAVSTYESPTGLSITITVATRPILLEFHCSQFAHTAANGTILAQILEGATQVAYGSVTCSPTGGAALYMPLRRRLAPSAGSHTYVFQWGSTVAGTHKLFATSTYPAYIRAVEC